MIAPRPRWRSALPLLVIASILGPLACATSTPPTRPERVPTPLEVAATPPLPVPSEEPDPEPAQVATEWMTIRLGLDASERFGEMRFRWVGVRDARCPLGAECVWEGRVTVTLEVSRALAEPQTVELSQPAVSATQIVVAAGHELELLSVEPHPRDGEEVSRDLYSARLRFRRLADAAESPASSGAS